MSEIHLGQLAERQRYAVFDGDQTIGAAHYRDLSTEHGIERVFFHTVVDEAYSGQGLASRLAAFALEDTIAQGHRVVAVCPYINAYTAKNRQYDAHLVAPGAQHLRILPAA